VEPQVLALTQRPMPEILDLQELDLAAVAEMTAVVVAS
jgi:hypothetical protein